MTLEELNGHYERREQLARAQEMLSSLRDAAHPGAQVLTGMPHTTGVKDRVGDLAVEIADLTERIEWMSAVVEEEEKKVNLFISEIEDAKTRIIFRLRFLRCLTWKEVSTVLGRGYSAKNVSEVCYKYLRATERDGTQRE